MLDQEQKLREAEYFYCQMVDSFQKELYDPFTYCMSAFLSAARSILQYTHERAKANGRINDYNNLISHYPILKYFKEKRDVNIHSQPVKPIQQVTLNVYGSLTVRVRESVRIQVIESDGTISRDETHESPGPDQTEKTSPLPSPTRTLQYRFEDRDEDVLDLSRQYLQNLHAFIQTAHTSGLI